MGYAQEDVKGLPVVSELVKYGYLVDEGVPAIEPIESFEGVPDLVLRPFGGNGLRE